MSACNCEHGRRLRELEADNAILRQRVEIAQEAAEEAVNAQWRALLVPPDEHHDAVSSRDEVILRLDGRVRDTVKDRDVKVGAMRAAVAKIRAGDPKGAEMILCLAIGGDGDQD